MSSFKQNLDDERGDLFLEKTIASKEEIEIPNLSAVSDVVPEFRRWFVLASFTFFNFVNGATWVAFSSIISQTETYYNISETQVLWFLWHVNILYPIISFPCSYLNGKKFFLSIMLGSIIMSIGSWVRYFAFKNYTLALFGQGLISVSTSLILAAPNTLANIWFPENERFWVLTVGCCSNSLGSGFGYLFSSIFVGDDSERIKEFLFVSSIIVSIPMLTNFFMIKTRKSANEKKLQIKDQENEKNEGKKQIGLYQSIKLLFLNKKYLICNLSFSICNTNCWNLLAIIDVFLQDAGLSNTEIGLVGLVLVISGFFGGIGGNLFLKYSKSKKYFDRIIKILFFISTVSFVFVSVLVPLRTYLSLLIIAIIFLGLGSFGLMPFACEAIEKIGSPVQESISVNGLYFLINIIGLPLAFISTLSQFGDYGLWTLSLSLIPFSFYIIGFYQTEEILKN